MKRILFAPILCGIGVVFSVIGNAGLFYEGGRVSIITIIIYPAIGFALGAWIDDKRGKPNS